MQRLQQVLLNLLSNALKFTDRGGSIKITSRFVVTEHDLTYKEPELIKLVEAAKYGMLEVSVADNGIGIKQEDLGKLFKLFGFLDSSKELNTKGIGLGLHISKMIC
jgi:signal transduction histidine kinase